MQVVEADPKKCIRWKLADRSGFEFGDIYALAGDIKKNGQIEPVLIRPYQGKEEGISYEVIAGSRRWRACLEANLPLKALLQEFSDEEAAIAQIKENQQVSICDYSKGIYYSKLIKEKTMTIAKLAECVGCSKAKIENFLSFERVPTEVWAAVGNLSRVSSRTAATIHALAQKGELYVEGLIEVAEDIRKGTGCKLIEKKVIEAVNGPQKGLDYQEKITLSTGQTIATWTKQGLQFSKDLSFDQKDFEKAMISYFENNAMRQTSMGITL